MELKRKKIKRYAIGIVLLFLVLAAMGIVLYRIQMKDTALDERTGQTDEHDGRMLAVMGETSGFPVYMYVSVDMDQDGQREMIGAVHDGSFVFIWYCSSDLKTCCEVTSLSYLDNQDISVLEQEGESHVVVNVYDDYVLGSQNRTFSILALHGGKIELLADAERGTVHRNGENDITLTFEARDAGYDKYFDEPIGHTWKDTYLYYKDGKYKEYGAAEISEQDFLKYDNAQELLDQIGERYQEKDDAEIRYSYFIRKNGIVHVQCDVDHSYKDGDSETTEFYYYTFHENRNSLEGELISNPGTIIPYYTSFEVTYP